MSLQTTWFILIGVLWTGFFLLEGFDFGVGMLTPFVGRDAAERGVLKETTGPFWDGNEVWLIVVTGATFAAFPDWYATMFSAFYMPLFVVLVALILRATGTEYRDRRDGVRWRTAWDGVIAVTCLLVPFFLGIALGGLLGGLPIDGQMEFTGSFVDLVQPFALITGVTFVVLSLLQGASFLRLRTVDETRDRASAAARKISLVAVVILAAQLIWTTAVDPTDTVIPGPWAWVAITAVVAAALLAHERRHEGWAFVASSATIASTVANLFATLYPNTMISTTSVANNLTTDDSSSSYTLKLITIVAAIMVPVVLVYTAWNYWVFRERVRPREPVAPTDEVTGA
jgi:cytochrome d ubiquinol oxidase subunit II